MGTSLAPIIANIVLTEFEEVAVAPLTESGVLKFCCKYLHYTLVLVKKDQTDKILKVFNSFHNNLWFTVGKFENEDIHLLN